jgi:crotonobetainyl-CoA:carnitine CoA-transferase CaiB-like acyl-CoA transferase
MSSDALGGIRVVDASTGRAGAVAAMLFADFGADVVKVAPAGDDPSSTVWDRGKTYLRGGTDLDALSRVADVVVTSAATHDHVLEANPALVLLRTPPSLDPDAWTGGRESEALLTARYGIPLRQASFDGGPIDSIYPVITTIQGIWGAACTVAALIERERSGLGQVVTVAGEHGVLVGGAGAFTFRDEVLTADVPRVRFGPGGSVPFYRTYQCGDGEWLFFAALTPRFTERGFAALGVTHLFDDPRLGGRGRAAMLAAEHSGWVIDAIAEAFRTAPRDKWLERLHEAGCPAGAVLLRDTWFDHPQVHAIGMAVDIDDPVHGRVTTLGVPVNLHATPGRVRARTISSSMPHWAPPDRTSRDIADSGGPLDGFRVLDLGAIIAGPLGASLLGELGADVIKVEPLTGDSFRGPGFAAHNKGQRGIALDLRQPDANAAFLDLVRTADVVLDNYRPGVLGRLGIEWQQLRDVNPNVISTSITGFGEGGPFGGNAGFDPVLQAMSGMMRAQGGDSDPVFFTVPVNDVAAAATVAFGTTLALFHRERTGESQKVTASLAAMSCVLQAEALARYEGRPPAPLGSRDHPGPSPLDRFYRASDGWIRIEAADLLDAQERLAGTGVDVSADPESAIEKWSLALTRAEAVEQLTAHGIPAVAARTVAELARADDVHTHDLLHRVTTPGREGYTAGRHAHFSRTMRSGVTVSPALGEHTREVLRELGYDDERIDALIASGGASERR